MLNVGEISLTLGIRRSEGRLYKQNDKGFLPPLPFVRITEDYASPVASNGLLMSSYLMKPPGKGLVCGSRDCEGQRDDETLPQFYL